MADTSPQAKRNCNQDMTEVHDLMENAGKEELEARLIEYCCDGSKDAVEFLLSRGVSADGTDGDGRTALIVSSMHGYEDIVALVLQHTDNIDVCDNNDMTALIYACINGHKKTAEVLMRGGADVDYCCDWDDKMAVVCACKYGHEEIAESLIVGGADEFTAMLYACQYGCEKTVKLLIERSAEFEIDFMNGYSALMIACKYGHEKVVKCLLAHGADVNWTNEDHNSALKVACTNGHIGIVELLMDHGASLDGVDAGPTAFMFACSNGHTNVAKFLIEKGADPNDRERELHNTSLMWASRVGHVEVVKLLLEHSVDVTTRDFYGQSALHWASSGAGEETLCLLLESGADVNECDRQGVTLLETACISRNLKGIELLIQHGATVNKSNFEECTPLELASESGNPSAVRLLLDHGADVRWSGVPCEPSLIAASKHGHKEVAELLIERGADVNGRDKECHATALMWACRKGRANVANVLVENGADVKGMDVNGKTPLIYACQCAVDYSDQCEYSGCSCGCEECVELLLHHDVGLDAQSNVGLSAAMFAVLADHVGCLEKLLLAGPNLELRDEEGQTVFSHAMKKKNTEPLKVLLSKGNLLDEDGMLKPVHKTVNKQTLDAVLVTIEFGVFEWEWCPQDHFLTVSLAALKSGICPGKTKYDSNLTVSPLIFSLIKNDPDSFETFLRHLYFSPEDYRILSTDNALREFIRDENLINKITLQPLSLQSWSFLTISKCLSLTGHPCLRRGRVDAIPVPEKFKKRLMFKID